VDWHGSSGTNNPVVARIELEVVNRVVTVGKTEWHESFVLLVIDGDAHGSQESLLQRLGYSLVVASGSCNGKLGCADVATVLVDGILAHDVVFVARQGLDLGWVGIVRSWVPAGLLKGLFGVIPAGDEETSEGTLTVEGPGRHRHAADVAF